MTTSIRKSNPPSRDADATKNRIMDAAEDEFSRAGLLGARTEAIAANTGVTKAMIFYHFGDKEGLYRAVLNRSVTNRLLALQKVDLHSVDPIEALRRYLKMFMTHAKNSPKVPPIFLFESVQNKGRFYSDLFVAVTYSPVVDILKRGIASGHFRSLDPEQAAVNVIGMCVFYYTAYNNVRPLWPTGTDLLSEEMKERHTQETIDMVIASVLNAPDISSKSA
jgi:TetR/AcrR family transcriptional regulator